MKNEIFTELVMRGWHIVEDSNELKMIGVLFCMISFQVFENFQNFNKMAKNHFLDLFRDCKSLHLYICCIYLISKVY